MLYHSCTNHDFTLGNKYQILNISAEHPPISHCGTSINIGEGVVGAGVVGEGVVGDGVGIDC